MNRISGDSYATSTLVKLKIPLSSSPPPPQPPDKSDNASEDTKNEFIEVMRKGGGAITEDTLINSSNDRTYSYMWSYNERSDTFIKSTIDLIQELTMENPALLDKFQWKQVHYRTPKHPSYDATTIYVRYSSCNITKYSPSSPPLKKRLKIMLVCGIHGRELFTSDFCRSWILYTALSSEKSLDQDSPSSSSSDLPCLDHSNRTIAPIDWLFVPIANSKGRDNVVDGYTDWYGDPLNLSSKSQRDASLLYNEDAWRMCHRGNGRGIDINRNWKTSEETIYGYKKGDRVPLNVENPGPEAFSEPESINLRVIVKEFQPDLLLAIHTGTVAILTPYDDTVRRPEDNSDLLLMANWIASISKCKMFKTKCSVGQGSRMLYSSKGTMGDFLYRQKLAAIPLTFEIYEGSRAMGIRANDDSRLYEDNDKSKSWGGNPQYCFFFFNPFQPMVLDHLNKWKSLWKALYYMGSLDQDFVRDISKSIISLDEELLAARARQDEEKSARAEEEDAYGSPRIAISQAQQEQHPIVLIRNNRRMSPLV